ncbi:MAG: hypothetical protein ACRDIV_12130 [Ktedonobacteraceae bacterium]
MLHSLRQRKVWLVLGLIAALLLVITGIFTLRIPLKAHAAGVTLYVGQTIGLNSGCTSPGFTSIQTAVDVANPGDTIYLCGTTPYAEQVIITKALTLTGDPGASIVAPNPFPAAATYIGRLPSQFTTDGLFVPQTVVTVWGTSSNVKIKNLIIAGVMPGDGGCGEQEFGVLVIAGGTAALIGDHVNDIRDTNSALYGCQFGVAIQVGREYWPVADFSTDKTESFIGHATIKTTTVSGYQKNGMTIDGPGTTAIVSGSTVNGAGRGNGNLLSPIIAQNGIQISRGASAQVMGNTITGNSYTGTGGASDGGILVYGGSCDGAATPLTTGTKVQNNNLQDNDVGVLIDNLSLDGNNQCSLPITPTKVAASHNHITNSAVSNVSGTNLLNFPGGYQAGISDVGNADQLINNQICGVGYTAVTPPPYLSMIDMMATNPTVMGNTVCTSSQNINAAASTQARKKGGLHYIARPIR